MQAKILTTQYIDGARKTSTHIGYFAEDIANQEKDIINIYPQVTYQRIEGFGGAITEAVGETLRKIPLSVADTILREYFGPDGIGYRMIRTHIDSCDFSLSQYAAVEEATDAAFDTFSLSRDEGAIIPFIQSAYRIAGQSLPIMLTPWSPPAFMKTNEARSGGKLKKECYTLWAEYICRYIVEYSKHGLDVSMLSVQNEPNAVQIWDSCVFTAEEEKVFLRDHLYPALVRHGLDEMSVYIWDHNKERIFDRAAAVIDPDTDPMIDGLAFHWYSGDHFEALDLVQRIYPGKKLLFSEGCIEYTCFTPDDPLKHAQMYAHDMIGNFKSGMNIFLDWNIVLDEIGGPNYVGNFCEAPIMCDTTSNTVVKNLSFYYIEHFSRYILPGAVRIATTQFCADMEVVAFKNPDGTMAMIILNRSGRAFSAYLRLTDRILPVTIPGISIGTYIISA